METNKAYEEIISSLDPCAPAPEDEPFRQYYFIARARKSLAEVEAKLGRKLTFHVATFGCQMNARDSEKLRGILEEIGYVPVDTEEADLVLYNTCTVRENANTKVYGRLGGLHSWKKKNPHMMIGLCGCMMQEEHVVKTIREKYRFVNLIFGTHNIYKLAELMSAPWIIRMKWLLIFSRRPISW